MVDPTLDYCPTGGVAPHIITLCRFVSLISAVIMSSIVYRYIINVAWSVHLRGALPEYLATFLHFFASRC